MESEHKVVIVAIVGFVLLMVSLRVFSPTGITGDTMTKCKEMCAPVLVASCTSDHCTCVVPPPDGGK